MDHYGGLDPLLHHYYSITLILLLITSKPLLRITSLGIANTTNYLRNVIHSNGFITMNYAPGQLADEMLAPTLASAIVRRDNSGSGGSALRCRDRSAFAACFSTPIHGNSALEHNAMHGSCFDDSLLNLVLSALCSVLRPDPRIMSWNLWMLPNSIGVGIFKFGRTLLLN